MYKKILQITLLFFIVKDSCAQLPWINTNSVYAPRYEDVFFVNQDSGFAVSAAGVIYRTLNAGQNWDTVYHHYGQYIRSVEFSSFKKGFAGSLISTGGSIFLKTLDGGNTWTDISNLITISNKGICGICSVDTNVTYAVGVYSAPAFVIKTTDGGLTWTQMDMSSYASRLVDVKFLNQNIGYVTGTSNVSTEGGVILKTIDGGLTWNKVHTTNNNGDYVWKIQNLDNMNWFCSIERGTTSGANKMIKSIDGGNVWSEKIVGYTNNYFQMVGFINKNRGWVGYQDLFETNDGGNTWLQLPVTATSCNRFFRLDSTFAYIAGNYIYKYDGLLTGVRENKIDYKFLEIVVKPNPHYNPLEINITSVQRTAFNLRLYNSDGRTEIYFTKGILENGENIISIPNYLNKGIYYVWVIVNEGVTSKKIIIE